VGPTRYFDTAAAGAACEGLAASAAYAIRQRQHPDPDGFDDRYVQVGKTFGGAEVIRGDLSPECAAMQAVLEALGRKHGPEDHRTEGQRFHKAHCLYRPRVRTGGGVRGSDGLPGSVR
jgi:hypothetical protein